MGQSDTSKVREHDCRKWLRRMTVVGGIVFQCAICGRRF